MRPYKPDTSHDQPHQEVWELLPWYVNRTLDSEELAHVEQHLARCPVCQAELARWHRIATAVCHAEEPEPSPSPERVATLMAQLDAVEAASRQRRDGWATLRDALGRYGARFADLPRFARLALAAEAGLIVLLAGVLLWQPQAGPQAPYTTLSRSLESPAVPQGQLRVVFAETMTVGDIRTLLGSVQATIIQGPSALGVYTLQVPLAGGAADAMQAVLTAFRAHPQVRLVEPISHP